MKTSFIILDYLLIIVMQPAHQSASSADYCKIDAAISYTGDNKAYFFKGDKYARWKDNDTLDFVGGMSN